jgi:DHA1 family solute carrier family 18 vesicular amine transporter 1/2
VMAASAGIGAARIKLPERHAEAEPIPVASIIRLPAVGACAAAVVLAAATVSMLEPVLALQLESLAVNPGRVGIVFGVAALASAGLHPVGGRLADRLGARRLTLWGLVISAAVLPLLGLMWNFESAIVFYAIQAAAMALVIAPSIAYMADAASTAGIGSFGVAYGLYNVAWGAGLLGGPAIGGFLFERLGFGRLMLAWAPAVVIATALIAYASANSFSRPTATRRFC